VKVTTLQLAKAMFTVRLLTQFLVLQINVLLTSFSFFSVVFCVVFIFDVYVLCI
jgi:hypothetical protein